MTNKQERALVEFVVGKLWKKWPDKWGCFCGGFQHEINCKCGMKWRLARLPLDMNLAGEVMRRMKKLGWLCTIQTHRTPESSAMFKNRNGDYQIFYDKRPELAILLAAKQALEGK